MLDLSFSESVRLTVLQGVCPGSLIPHLLITMEIHEDSQLSSMASSKDFCHDMYCKSCQPDMRAVRSSAFTGVSHRPPRITT